MTTRLARLRIALPAWALVCASGLPLGHAQEAAAAVYLRSETGGSDVVEPRLRVRSPISPTTAAELVYTVDAWSSASVDVVGSASQRLSETRHQIAIGADQRVGGVHARLTYAYATQPDLVSHTGSAAARIGLAEDCTRLAAAVAMRFDRLGRIGDPLFKRTSQTVDGRAVLTQLIDRNTVAQALYEVSSVTGYQDSPYRFVAIGSPSGCGSSSSLCIPEHSPEQRLRQAWALRARRALGDRLSAGLDYRFYLDSWHVSSHTVQGSVTFLPAPADSISLTYRGYLQTAASHYLPRVVDFASRQFMTADRRLSAMSSQRGSLEVERHSKPGRDRDVSFGASFGFSWYGYRSSTRLDPVQAVDATLWVALLL